MYKYSGLVNLAHILLNLYISYLVSSHILAFLMRFYNIIACVLFLIDVLLTILGGNCRHGRRNIPKSYEIWVDADKDISNNFILYNILYPLNCCYSGSRFVKCIGIKSDHMRCTLSNKHFIYKNRYYILCYNSIRNNIIDTASGIFMCVYIINLLACWFIEDKFISNGLLFTNIIAIYQLILNIQNIAKLLIKNE